VRQRLDHRDRTGAGGEAAALPVRCESQDVGIPSWNDMVHVPGEAIERGFVRVPDGPGNSVEVDVDLVRAHLAVESIAA
jgi:hypothetical protein